MILLLYVVDAILTSSSFQLISSVITDLTTKFEMKDLGTLHYSLCLQIKLPLRGYLCHNQSMSTTTAATVVVSTPYHVLFFTIIYNYISFILKFIKHLVKKNKKKITKCFYTSVSTRITFRNIVY